MLTGKTILITGGTGTFGKKFTEIVLNTYKPKKIIIFSRDEFKQYQMAQDFPESKYPIRYFIGDVRDKERVIRAFHGVDYVIHAAAMKQVPTCEYNPFEAVHTNIIGAQNIVEAAIQQDVKKVIAISTDKAVSPINLYGATKLAMEKIFISSESYIGDKNCLFSVVRYGNVIGSRGSVTPFFSEIKKSGKNEYPVTDPEMTRFWITIEKGVELALFALKNAAGAEVFIPKIPSMKIIDLVHSFDLKAKLKIIGIRPGEKLHESLISIDESRNTYDIGEYFVILPQFIFKEKLKSPYSLENKVPDNFVYASNTNKDWLTIGELKKLISNENY